MTCGLRLQRPGFSKARRRILRPANVVIVSGVPGLSRWANLACARLTTFASTRNMSLAAGSVGKLGTSATRGQQAVNVRPPSQSLSKSTLWPGDVSGDAHRCIGGQRRLHYSLEAIRGVAGIAQRCPEKSCRSQEAPLRCPSGSMDANPLSARRCDLRVIASLLAADAQGRCGPAMLESPALVNLAYDARKSATSTLVRSDSG